MAFLKPTIFAIALAGATCGSAWADFNTIKRESHPGYERVKPHSKEQHIADTLEVDSLKPPVPIAMEQPNAPERRAFAEKRKRGVRKKHLAAKPTEAEKSLTRDLPPLTVPNLIAEIRRQGLLHRNVVLAQAILETGWFTSSVCRNKNNLFGLTNPRTGQYYEFAHWTESVKAYGTKVQYKYKGGDYLAWLRSIGYAEDPRYVSSLLSLMRQYGL